MNNLDDIFCEFIEEALESLHLLEDCLRDLEKDPTLQTKTDEAFRHIHTLKGNSSCFEMKTLTSLAHLLEDVMGRMREGELTVNQEIVQDLIVGVDQIGFILSDPENSQNVSCDEAISLLEKYMASSSSVENSVTKSALVNPFKEVSLKCPDFLYWIRLTGDDSLAFVEELEKLGKIHQHATSESCHDFLFETVLESTFFDILDYEIHIEEIDGNLERVVENKKESLKPVSVAEQKTVRKENFARINYQLLDKLIELSGELILCRNQFTRKLEPELLQEFHALSMLINDMQDGLMMTRMQPFSIVSSKFPRMIRDTSRKLNKKVKFEVLGENIEMDRTILEGAKAIFTHVLRNSLDHGIESPEERISNGKSGEGLLKIDVTQSTGYVQFTVSDDGAGISRDKIKAKAVSNGIITKVQADAMDHDKALNLIYSPGFSTSGNVTDISGRGVGMDVVKTEIEKLGGSISVKSEEGYGTTFTIKLPQSMSILHSLIVKSRKQSYAIPRNNISEVLKVTEDQSDIFQEVEGSTLLKHRGRLLPLLNLNTMIDSCTSKSTCLEAKTLGAENYPVTIIVIKQMDKSYGLVVDEVLFQEEVVIKPLNEFLESFKIFTGMTILSTGKVCFILDVHNLAEKGNIKYSDIVSISGKSSVNLSKDSFFVFENYPNERFAIPIGQVEMIHQLKSSELARCGDDYFVDIIGKEYKVIDLSSYVPSRSEDIFEEENVYIIRLKGIIGEWVLACNKLIGTEDFDTDLKCLPTESDYTVGQLIHEQIVTNFLDIMSIDCKRSNIQVDDSREILIVDDSRIVRNMMSQVLRSNGYKVITAENGRKAVEVLESNKVSIIFSDIEMPVMTGYELAMEIKEKQLSSAPLIAVSSLKSDKAKEQAFKSGFDHFLLKFDLNSLMDYLQRETA